MRSLRRYLVSIMTPRDDKKSCYNFGMFRSIKTEAIVLKKRNLLNKDIVLTILSEKKGKIGVFAKGIRTITSRRQPHIQTGNLITVLLSEKDNRYYLQETTLISGFSKIKDNEIKHNSLYTILFILERILPDNQQEEQVYEISKKFLIELSESEKFTATRLIYYINKLMQVLGFVHEEKPLSELRPIIEDIIHDKLPEFN
jgi:DNA repair protein RecO (recombination protein O)